MAIVLHIRPSELAGYQGSEVAKLLFDAEVLSKAEVGEPKSTKELIRRHRRELGMYG